MSAEGDALKADLAAIETELASVCAKVVTYVRTSYPAAARAYAATGRRTEELEQAIGPSRLFRILAARLGELGCEQVLEYPRVQGPFSAGWVEDLEPTIDRFLP